MEVGIDEMTNGEFTKEQLIKQLNEIYYKLSILEQKENEPIYQAFDKIVDMSPVGIVFVNKQGEIINANPRAEEILGLSKEALQRYGNLKAAHQEKAVQLLVILGQSIQQGHIKEKISDEKLKDILKQLQPEKKDFKIKRI